MRQLRTHAAAAHDFLSWHVALCDGSSFHTLTNDPFAVDCHICMYRLGLYMPLSKLDEHQRANRKHCGHQIEFFNITEPTHHV